MIRRSAKVGDWIIGFRSKAHDQVLYVMRVEEKLSFADYWSDPRFAPKRPDQSAFSDNIYRPDVDGHLQWVLNDVHDDGHAPHDISGTWVLVSREFWYFGRESQALPTDLIHLIQRTQGHTVHKNRKGTDLAHLERWLTHWKPGLHGQPIDRDVDLAAMGEMSGYQTKSCGANRRRTR